MLWHPATDWWRFKALYTHGHGLPGVVTCRQFLGAQNGLKSFERFKHQRTPRIWQGVRTPPRYALASESLKTRFKATRVPGVACLAREGVRVILRLGYPYHIISNAQTVKKNSVKPQ